MIIPHFLKGKNVAVLGLGRSGRSVAHALLRAGAHVLAIDDQESACQSARNEGIPTQDPNSIEWVEVDCLVLSPGIPHLYPAPHSVVSRAQLAGISPISDIELLYLTQTNAKYIGITGTNGKSTTTSLIGHILKEGGIRAEVGGNLGVPVMNLNPLDEKGFYVLEISSYQLETTPSLHCDIGVLLNISPDHLERHGGMEGYIKAKKLIYKNAKSSDTLIISVDDPYCLAIYEELKQLGTIRLLPISICKMLSEGIFVNEGVLHENATPIVDLQKFNRLKGRHNWQNIAAAYGALRVAGLEIETILQGISSFPGLAHRQQVVASHKNVQFVNDSKATNAEAVSKALACYEGSPLYWLVGGRPKEGGILSLKPYFSTFRHVFLYGEAAVSFSLTLEGQAPYTLCETLEEAVKQASSMAFRDHLDGAIVLLSPACASFDQFSDFEARGNAFCVYVKNIIGNEK